MIEQDNLDAFLNGDTTAEQPVEQVEAPEQPRDDAGRFAPKGEPEQPEAGASPVPEQLKEPELDHKALLGERRRRQDAEARLAELERQLSAPQTTVQPQTVPDMFEDPAGYTQWLKDEAKREAIA